jgi:hypothetical protein
VEVALARAADFVAAQGDALARARSEALRGAASADAALAHLDDADLSAPEALARVLGVCDELRALRSPLARRAFAALEEDAAPDGALAPATWELPARLRRTGDLGGVLARSPFGRPEVLEAAGDFLAAHFTPDLFQGFQWENIAAYAHFFANALHDAADEVLQWCGRELERGYRAQAFDALRTARVLVLCDAHGLPGAAPLREELLLSLLAEQGRDGSFGAGAAPEERVEPTLHGLRALGFLAAPAPSPVAPLDSGAPAR